MATTKTKPRRAKPKNPTNGEFTLDQLSTLLDDDGDAVIKVSLKSIEDWKAKKARQKIKAEVRGSL